MSNLGRHQNRHLGSSEMTMPTSANVYQCWWAAVGVTGFEPATLCSQSRCATKLRYTPWVRVGPKLPGRTGRLPVGRARVYPIGASDGRAFRAASSEVIL